MPRKKIPYKEGTWFAVPLRGQSGYGLGLVARFNGKGGVLGYFFNKRFFSPPKPIELTSVGVDDVVFVRQFGDLGLIRDLWPIIGEMKEWSREQWPVPFFARIAVDNSVAWRAKYSDNDGITLLAEQEIPIWEARLLPEDGLSGYGAIEIRLAKVLEAK